MTEEQNKQDALKFIINYFYGKDSDGIHLERYYHVENGDDSYMVIVHDGETDVIDENQRKLYRNMTPESLIDLKESFKNKAFELKKELRSIYIKEFGEDCVDSALESFDLRLFIDIPEMSDIAIICRGNEFDMYVTSTKTLYTGMVSPPSGVIKHIDTNDTDILQDAGDNVASCNI